MHAFGAKSGELLWSFLPKTGNHEAINRRLWRLCLFWSHSEKWVHDSVEDATHIERLHIGERNRGHGLQIQDWWRPKHRNWYLRGLHSSKSSSKWMPRSLNEMTVVHFYWSVSNVLVYFKHCKGVHEIFLTALWQLTKPGHHKVIFAKGASWGRKDALCDFCYVKVNSSILLVDSRTA